MLQKLSMLFIWVFVIFTTQIHLHAQKNEQIKTGWKVTPYNEKIIKLTYQPKDYVTNENLSDAVILKPNNKVSISHIQNNDTIYVGDDKKLIIAYTGLNDGYRWLQIMLQANEKIYGGGERALPLDRRGYTFDLDNNPWYGYGNGADNLNFSVPFFTSSEGYGLFFDNASKGKADIGKTKNDVMQVGFVSGELNLYIILGKDYKEILKNYHALTGTQGLPPRWALGNFMSRFGYTSEKQVEEIAAKMKDEKIPFDAIIYDLFWFGDSIKGTLGNLEWVNKTKWPNPEKMIRGFSKENIKTILISEPFILKSSKNYKNSTMFHAVDSLGNPFELTDFYFGMGGLIDIFRKDAQKWFWEKHDSQNKKGVHAWWGDLGEPEKHPLHMYHKIHDKNYSRLFRSDEVHNIYGHTWTKILFENFSKSYPDKRLFSLNRSGFAGSQRYNIIPWSGDVSRSWSGFQAQMPIMLGMSMCGIPYIHADAGGFAGGEGDLELYIRWLQFAVFTPIFRPHGTALFEVDPNAFSFPSEPALHPDPYKKTAREIIKLRYSLLPYNYTLSYRQTAFGEPLVAPLYYHFPKDAVVSKIEDQFMWGDNILVAPIQNKAQTERKVSFPAGNWYPLGLTNSNSTSYTGSISFKTTLESILAFVKEGSFIPTIEKDGKTSEDYRTDSLTIHYFPSNKSSTYTLFDDDGLSKNSIKNNKFELIHLTAEPTRDKLIIKISSNQGKYKGKPKGRNIKFIFHDQLGYSSVAIDSKIENLNSKTENIKMLTVDFRGKDMLIQLKK